MLLSLPVILDQIEALQLEALESCSHDTKKLLLEISIEKTQLLKNSPLASRFRVSPALQDTHAVGSRIQIIREILGLTEAELARKLNTYSDHISDWECGISEPPASMVIPLANCLKCDLMWLLTGEPVAVARES
ncbi:helix-turn-helix domain-containing protein [Cedecea sp.]|jgi:DNA-binding transcriptional regulator YiaG|uniref:helix-turn-helix domain-containing protein n=1 Tax=Cedecea sp. TaxID=1970739 RepID=UPI002F40C479